MRIILPRTNETKGTKLIMAEKILLIVLCVGILGVTAEDQPDVQDGGLTRPWPPSYGNPWAQGPWANAWGPPQPNPWDPPPANPWIPPWVASAPWMPKWAPCTQPGPSCVDCNTRLICTKIGGIQKACTDPALPHCDLGECVATPSAQCAPAETTADQDEPVEVVEEVPATAE